MGIQIIKAEDNWQERLVKGKWQVPELFGNETFVYGELIFGGERHPVLSLSYMHDDLLAGVDCFKVVKIRHIIGSCIYDDEHGNQNNVAIDLYDCFVSKISTSLSFILSGRNMLGAEIVASDVWCGDANLDAETKNDISFQSLSVGIKGLEAWCGGSFFKPKIKEKGIGAIIDYTSPEPLKIYDDFAVSVSIVYTWHGLKVSLCQNEMAIGHYSRIVIDSKQGPLRYYGDETSFEFYLKLITIFFAILIGDGASPYAIIGSSGGIAYTSLFECREKSYIVNPRQRKTPWSVYRLIKEKIPTLLSTFISSFKNKYNELYTLHAYLNGLKKVDIKSNSELLFAFESLYNRVLKAEGDIYAGQCERLIEKQRVKESILRKCETEEEKRIVNANINIVLSFAMKLQVAMSECKKDFAGCLSRSPRFWDGFLAILKDTRISGAHSLATKTFDGELYIATHGLIQAGLIWMVLKGSGFSINEMRHVLASDYNFDWNMAMINKRICELLDVPLFSIIIPIYNVAPYLRECLDSIIDQTIGNWEAICVDDGSTDGGGAILDEYVARDKRFKVIHQKNAGVSTARNVGLNIATGEWFLFLDGDDTLRSEALSTFVPYVEGDRSCDGILVQPSIPYWNGDCVPERKVVPRILVESATKEDLILGPHAANGLVISRIYRRSKFGQLRFRKDIAMAEDVCFWFDALCIDARWTIINAEYYLYRQRPDSACGLRNPHFCFQALESVAHAVRVISKNSNIFGDVKLQYLLRFPYTVVHNLNLAIARRNELSCDEWLAIKGKVEELVREVGCWPFGCWLKIKLLLVFHPWSKLLLPLVLNCESTYLYARRVGGAVCRKMKLRK